MNLKEKNLTNSSKHESTLLINYLAGQDCSLTYETKNSDTICYNLEQTLDFRIVIFNLAVYYFIQNFSLCDR